MPPSWSRWEFPLHLGPENYEEEEIGTVSVLRAPLEDGIAAVIGGYQRLETNRSNESFERKLRLNIEHAREELPDALSRFARAFVRSDRQLRARCHAAADPSHEFLAWLEAQPWDPMILALPSVQEQMENVLRTKTGNDVRRLGYWLERKQEAGKRIRGRRRVIDRDEVRRSVSTTDRQLRRLSAELQSVCQTTRRFESAWEQMRKRHPAAVVRIERAGQIDAFKRRRPRIRDVAYSVVADEHGLGRANVEKIARQRIRSKVRT